MLRANRHLRYMWIPHTDRVVVVTNNPHPPGKQPPRVRATYTEAERTAALRTLLKVRRSDAPQLWLARQLLCVFSICLLDITCSLALCASCCHLYNCYAAASPMRCGERYTRRVPL